MTWTPAVEAQLMGLWMCELPTRDIAERLGMTRNQVIGKAHRLGLQFRGPKPKDPKPRAAKNERARRNGVKSAAAISAKKQATVRQFAVPLGKVSECRWPEGDPKRPDFHFCEAPTEPGRPYCHAHCLRAYVQPQNEQTRRLAAE